MFSRSFFTKNLRRSFALKKDPFLVLGVSKNASDLDIKKAYSNLVKKHHPDVNNANTSAQMFNDIKEAYALISNETKRKNFINKQQRQSQQPFTSSSNQRTGVSFLIIRGIKSSRVL